MAIKDKAKIRIKEKQVQVSPVLENIVKNLSLTGNLESEWNVIGTVQFSKEKVLFPYQVSAIENAIKALYKFFKFFKDKEGKKSSFAELKSSFAELYDNHDVLSLDLKEDLLDIVGNRFKLVDNGRIPFEQICNRMSFWMATGSGKTLVIVKLIDVLFQLMDADLIPQKPIMFLTAREDLLNSFKKYVDEFNSYHYVNESKKSIRVIDLNCYTETISDDNSYRKVFAYRSDLISNEGGNKTLNFEAFLKGKEPRPTGDWYVILDEAHKGEKGDSKRQLIINILAQEGFLFNFSATFTDPIDIATTVYNLNLAEFLKLGYGKQIYVSQSEIKGFGRAENKGEFTEEERKKIILKTLILLASLKKAKEKEDIREYYHNPLAVFLVNSVNQKEGENDTDLKLLFNELLALSSKIDENLFNTAKKELIGEFENGEYTLGEGDLKFMGELLNKLSINDIYTYVYNSNGPGTIEYIHYPENHQELALKHTSSNKPFALIKLGTTEKIIKGFLSGYLNYPEHSETRLYERLYEDQRWFENLNENDSPFNLLIGSRAFYEGWDSSRPNIIVFINLGQQATAKKFVLQSIGRGVRIEPVKNERMRSSFLKGKREDIYNKAGTARVKALESLFIFGTKKEVIETVLKEINSIKPVVNWDLVEFRKNEQTEGKLLLIPNYRQGVKKIYELSYQPKFTLSQENYELLKMYFDLVPKERFLLERGCTSSEFQQLQRIINNRNTYIQINPSFHYRSFDRLLSALLSYIRNDFNELDTEEPLIDLPENVIVHFKNIMVDKNMSQDFKNKLNTLYKSQYVWVININNITIEKLLNHYYIPIAYINNQSANELIKHIITVDSEVNFLNALKSKMECISDKCDYWFFSKLDENKDKGIYIPYIDKSGHTRKFIPDFIFWFKLKSSNNSSNRYIIYFVDPKSGTYTDYELKVDGYETVFTDNGVPKVFNYTMHNENGRETYRVEVRLKLFGDPGQVGDKYRNYWVDGNTLFNDI